MTKVPKKWKKRQKRVKKRHFWGVYFRNGHFQDYGKIGYSGLINWRIGSKNVIFGRKNDKKRPKNDEKRGHFWGRKKRVQKSEKKISALKREKKSRFWTFRDFFWVKNISKHRFQKMIKNRWIPYFCLMKMSKNDFFSEKCQKWRFWGSKMTQNGVKFYRPANWRIYR